MNLPFLIKPNFCCWFELTWSKDVTARDELLDMLREFMEQDESRSILISSHISTDLETLWRPLYDWWRKDYLSWRYRCIVKRLPLLKATPQQYMDNNEMQMQKENYGYRCLTNQNNTTWRMSRILLLKMDHRWSHHNDEWRCKNMKGLLIKDAIVESN